MILIYIDRTFHHIKGNMDAARKDYKGCPVIDWSL
jgi:hypothetical protein